MVTETRVTDTATEMAEAVETSRQQWSLVPESARIGWTARKKYLMVIPVTARGSFSQVSGTIAIPGDRFEDAKATIRIPVSSHSSGQPKRDKHLLGPDFFHVDQYAFLTFESTDIRRIDSGVTAYEVTGHLTVRDTRMPLTLTGTLEPSPEGDRAHIWLTGSFNRRDAGMAWNAVPMMKLHDDISLGIDIDIQRA